MKLNFNFREEGLLLKIAFFFFGLIPLTSERLEVFVSIFFCSMVLGNFILNIKSNKLTKLNSLFVINSLLFFVLLITFFDGIDILAIKKLEQMVSLLVFPITFYFLSAQDKINAKKLFDLWKKVFFVSTVVFCLISFYLISQYSNPRYPNFDSNFFQNAILDNTYFARHPGYISIFINISILTGFDWIFNDKKYKYIGLIISPLIVLFILLTMLSVKIALLSLVVSLTIYLCLTLSRNHIIIGVLTIFLGIVLFSLLLPNRYNRFSKIFDTNSLNKNTQYNSVLVHKLTVFCAAEIFKENLLIGVGVENAKDKVDNCTRQHYFFEPEIIYNSHNQYLGYALYSGVFGFFVLPMVLLFAMFKSFKGERLIFVIMILYCIVFLTENVLERQSGLILFCFFLNMIPVLNNNGKCLKQRNKF